MLNVCWLEYCTHREENFISCLIDLIIKLRKIVIFIFHNNRPSKSSVILKVNKRQHTRRMHAPTSRYIITYEYINTRDIWLCAVSKRTSDSDNPCISSGIAGCCAHDINLTLHVHYMYTICKLPVHYWLSSNNNNQPSTRRGGNHQCV